MSAWTLCSCLATQIQNLITLRRLSGTTYRSQAQLLGYFDRFLVDQKFAEPRLTREITDAYQQSLLHLRPRVQYNRFCVVRQLAEYLARADPCSYVPEALKLIRPEMARSPYIYSSAELQALLAAAEKLPPVGSLRSDTYRTLFGLLYSTGIRIGEALALNLQNFHDADQRIYIAEGKFRKARWVPVSTSTCRVLQQYITRRLRFSPRSSDAPLFLNQRACRLHHVMVHQVFRRLLRQAGIAYHQHTGPRIHDLRHTFAVHRLLAWYRDGQDVNARLPWLATYMGHVNILSTQVYLHATPALIEQVDHRFHHHYLTHIQPNGERQ